MLPLSMFLAGCTTRALLRPWCRCCGTVSRAGAQLRSHAAEALAYLGTRRAVPALIAALDDPSPAVRLWSAFALGELSDRRAVSPLERLAATDVSPVPGWWTVSEEAREALKRLEAAPR